MRKTPTGWRRIPLFALLAVGLSVAKTAAADDIVFLKDGGRARGTVVEETKSGVRIKLVDGTVKTYPKADVDHVQYGDTAPAAPTGSAAPAATAPPPPASPEGAAPPAPAAPAPAPPVAVAPANGKLHVTTSQPGTVFVDGDERGRAPLDVDVEPGSHVIKVSFDGSGRASKRVHVAPGETREVAMTKSAAATIADARKGPHFSAGAEIGWAKDDKESGLGFRLSPGGTFGLGTFIDLRADLIFALGVMPDDTTTQITPFQSFRQSSGPAWAVGPDLQVHLNLGPVYAPWAGGGIALFHPGLSNLVESYDSKTGTNSRSIVPEDNTFAALMEVSPAWFRLGDAGQYELGLVGSMYWHDHHTLLVGINVGATYVFTQL